VRGTPSVLRGLADDAGLTGIQPDRLLDEHVLE
jgi:hypothetical protein